MMTVPEITRYFALAKFYSLTYVSSKCNVVIRITENYLPRERNDREQRGSEN